MIYLPGRREEIVIPDRFRPRSCAPQARNRLKILRFAALGAALAVCLAGCPNAVPDANQFGADAAAAADSGGSLDGAPGNDTAPADTASGGDATLGPDSPDPTSGDTAAADAAGPDGSPTDAAPGDTAAADAGCSVNGCGTAPPCKKLTCMAIGSCSSGNAADNSPCGDGHSCHSGLCLADPVKAVQVVAAGYTTCARLTDGTVQCWGDGATGQLGDGQTGSGHSSATPGPVEGVSGATDLACGPSHCCAVANGAVLCWGDNEFGGSSPAAAAKTLVKPTAVPEIADAVAVAAGGYHSCAIVGGGAVKCWGLGTAGQLGDGLANIPKAVVKAKLGAAAATVIVAGPNHTCVRTATGTGLCWGYNEDGELGDGNGGTSKEADTPVVISGLQGIATLSAGENHGCAIVVGGSVRCWGKQSSGQLGTGGGNSYYSTPQVVALDSATAIAAGGSHSCAAVTGGGLWCWGGNGNGQLGLPAAASNAFPAELKGFGDVLGVAAGTVHTCAVRGDGTVWCWGDSYLGQCGPLAGKGSSTPTQAY